MTVHRNKKWWPICRFCRGLSVKSGRQIYRYQEKFAGGKDLI